MAEFWWGRSPKAEIRHHGYFYPACKGKCESILKHMLQGLEVEDNPLSKDHHRETHLEIVYEDDWLLIVNKSEGMLSVPGKTDMDSVYQRLKKTISGSDRTADRPPAGYGNFWITACS